MALLPPDPVYTIRNVDNVPVYSLAFSFLPGGLERLLAGSKNGYVYAYNLQVRSRIYFKHIIERYNYVESINDVSYGFHIMRDIFVYYPRFAT